MLAPGDPRHGTDNGYQNHDCRCDACRAAHNWAHNEWRWRTGRNVPRAVQVEQFRAARVPRHGTETEYVRYGCRCPECREASARARRERRQRVSA